MAINFIPNDPLAIAALPMRQQAARTNRPAGRAGFTFSNTSSQKVYAPGTPGFLFWQCREAALLAVEVWEGLDGALARWARAASPKKLALRQNAGIDLNAYYDGQSVSFFEYTGGGKTTHSGASTDVVAHEVGHGLLDAIRPDLWDINLTEAGAFHEAFGDCMAILTALGDRATRDAVLMAPLNPNVANFVETTAEDLSDGVRRSPDPRLGPTHAASSPRHALNNFNWQLPATLPASGGPLVLTREVHTFGQVFSGCFYDTIRNIFASFPTRSEATLWTAAQTAGRVLIAGTRSAPAVPRFFQAVGRAMILADQNMNGGANRQAIRDAFTRHNVALGSASLLAPRASLAGAVPTFAARGAVLSLATRRDLKERIRADRGAKMSVGSMDIGGETVAQAVHYREVPLRDVSEKLKGVVAIVPEPILVGTSGRRAAVLSALPEKNATTDEVHAFVESLLDNDAIAIGDAKAAAAPRRAARSAVVSGRGVLAQTLPSPQATHAVQKKGGQRVLTRVRFVCGCGA